MKKNHTSHQHHTDSETPMGHNFEQFQRLSAYFDGEATPAERKEIQHLLDTDPQVKQQYQQLRQLKQALQLLPIPTSISAQYLGQRVLARLRRSQLRTLSLWGSGAIAALFVAGVMGQMPRLNLDRFAKNDPDQQPTAALVETPPQGEEALVVALNRPVLQIPKLATTESP
ncbi:anti-sigma factor [Picosynechococcus sp. PCC 7117]|uniref:anti-sigma factor family protein n=1 Tax=Picosynechococcus sp. PCC 7117 TaxID=195498 RepID=UPI0012ED1CC2|nr:Fis family transcriptional regulator [Picosynechococcus sp. PCC 7117]